MDWSISYNHLRGDLILNAWMTQSKHILILQTGPRADRYKRSYNEPLQMSENK